MWERLALAEEVGFEPTDLCRSHDFQSCRFGRSRTPPNSASTLSLHLLALSRAVAGFCATGDREPSQSRKAAALSGFVCVPQVTWLLRTPAPVLFPGRLTVKSGPQHRPPSPVLLSSSAPWPRSASSVGRSLGAVVDYQSLYRRYRPQRFSEVRGQDHVVNALRHAVRDDRVAHAYLFSGPRGTGKTSTARILAKALNCANPLDGEPCGVCDSCLDITRGASFDVHELDAASNNGVEAMRDLVARASLATPGRWKVYIVDEVHMLSASASNALLKTLE